MTDQDREGPFCYRPFTANEVFGVTRKPWNRLAPWIVSSNDPRALRLYARSGFALHPTLRADGLVDRRALPHACRAIREDDRDGDLESLAALTRAIRGAPYTAELRFALARGGRLLRLADRGFAVASCPAAPSPEAALHPVSGRESRLGSGIDMTLRSRDGLVILLALTTGATDAMAFERLGNAFASVITGNLVLLGVGAARAAGRLALFSGCALVGYAIGVVASAPRRHEQSGRQYQWPRTSSVALIADLVLLAAVMVGWELSGGRPGKPAQLAMLAVAAAAMGVQSTAIRRLGPMSTTYLTSTFIGVFEALAARRWSSDETRSVAILCVALVGAAGATVLILHAPRLLPAVPLAPLVIAIVASRPLLRQAN